MRIKFLLLFIVILFCVNPAKTIAQVSMQDSLALVDYYDSTYGIQPWQWGQVWDFQSPVSSWVGVGVSNKRVVSIRLWGGGGAGHIPASFGNLTALQSIDFLDNRLDAVLPASFANLISLTGVSFHAVFGDLPFPAALTKAPNLQRISMEDNYFTDSIPSSMSNLTKLTSLDLFQNSLTGAIPKSINQLPFLGYMDISYNRYTFKGIEPFVADYIASQKTYTLVYSSQANIPLHQYNSKLAVSAGGTLTNNTFKWYKDNSLVATITGDSTYMPLDTGKYYVTITNSIATDLTLYTDEITVKYVLPVSALNATQNVTGTSPVNITNGIFEIAKIQPTAGANQLTGSVTALVNIEPAVSNFYSLPYVQRHYDITPAVNASNAQASVTLYFTQNDFDNYNNYVTTSNLNLPLLPTNGGDNGNMRIMQFHGNFAGSSRPENYSNPNFVLIIPVVVWDTGNQWWSVTFSVTGFSGFFLTTGSSTLPLTLVNFNGKMQRDGIMLQWLTANEVSTKEFSIERSSQGNIFNTIGRVTAKSTQSENLYEFTDIKPLDGINFYRLHMVDKDGTVSFSKTISLNYKAAISALQTYPNPASSLLSLKISSGNNESVLLKITDALGSVLFQTRRPVNAGITFTSVNIENLPAGVYYLSAYLKDGVKKVAFVKK